MFYRFWCVEQSCLFHQEAVQKGATLHCGDTEELSGFPVEDKVFTSQKSCPDLPEADAWAASPAFVQAAKGAEAEGRGR